MWEYVGICKNMLEYIRICTSTLEYVGIDRNMQNMTEYAGIFWNMEIRRIYRNMQGSVGIYKNKQ